MLSAAELLTLSIFIINILHITSNLEKGPGMACPKICNMKKTTFTAACCIFILGLCLRLYHLGTPSLWLDEIGQAVAALNTWAGLFNVVAGHLSPPLDYMLLKMVLVLGHSDWIVRLPAFVYGVVSLPLMFVFTRKISDEETAVLGMAGLSLSPMAVAYSQEARMYSLFLCLSLLSYILCLRYYRKRCASTSVLLGLVNGALLLTHYFALFLLFAEMTILIAALIRKKAKVKEYAWLIGSVALSSLMFAPWIPFMINQNQNSGGQIWYALSTGQEYFKNVFNGFSLNTGGEEGVWFYSYIAVFTVGLICAMFKKQYSILVLALAFLLMIAGFYFLNSIKKITTTRNLIFLLPVYLAVGANGLNYLFKQMKLNQWIGVALIAIALFLPIYRYHTIGRPDFKPDWKGAADYLREPGRAEEKIFVPDTISRGSLYYYLKSDSEFVYGRRRSGELSNDPKERVWVVTKNNDDKNTYGELKGYFILPPNLYEDDKREKVMSVFEGRSLKSAKTFPTQEKGYPLEIFKIE